MKKIRPLTFLNKLASLTNITGRETGQDLSNEKTLSAGQEGLVSGCGIYEPNDPRVSGAFKPVKPDASDGNTSKVLSDSLSAEVMGGTGAKKPPRHALTKTDDSSNIVERKPLSTEACILITGGTGAKKPPRAACINSDLLFNNAMDN
ncbi:hypothetical protein [Pseudoalteromonas sp. OOF1S-7]|uniref:hypothetical protein n=1 Tax=Pseudoalteromonas sp. OOF1S-7 TaxID=2917757 RepID=UPI001EF4746B|nr:hypothetical protein [Pseudoalteromonas sp. OOF1S-7]MCG7534277.1 hypothetical protein [Pseudoalteromonas sp. OOF1S-7]